jgi:hypothetical protein
MQAPGAGSVVDGVRAQPEPAELVEGHDLVLALGESRHLQVGWALQLAYIATSSAHVCHGAIVAAAGARHSTRV